MPHVDRPEVPADYSSYPPLTDAIRAENGAHRPSAFEASGEADAGLRSGAGLRCPLTTPPSSHLAVNDRWVGHWCLDLQGGWIDTHAGPPCQMGGLSARSAARLSRHLTRCGRRTWVTRASPAVTRCRGRRDRARGPSGVEPQPESCGDPERGVRPARLLRSAMEPQPESCGDLNRIAGKRLHAGAAMEPQPEGCGDLAGCHGWSCHGCRNGSAVAATEMPPRRTKN